MRRVRVLAILAAIAALTTALLPGAAQAGHSWNNYHWARTASPFTLQVVDSVSADWQSEYGTALTEWSQSGKLDLESTSTDDGARARKQCRAVSGMMRVCNAAYGLNGWLGLASISISQGHIVAGTAKMNDSYDWYWADPLIGANEKRHVMCQEIGHVLGLGHTSEDGSSQKTCMDYSEDPQSTSPNAHDYAQLDAIYGHTDTYNSYATSGGGGDGGGGGDCNPRSPKCSGASADGRDFGELVSSSRHHEMWVRRGPGGTMTITHVRLAP